MSYIAKQVFFQHRQPFLACLKRVQLAQANLSAPVQGIPNTKIKSVGDKTSEEDANCTKSRAHFAELYPKLYAKQEYHIKQLKADIPVHASGKSDPVILPIIYVSSVLLFVYSLYALKNLM